MSHRIDGAAARPDGEELDHAKTLPPRRSSEGKIVKIAAVSVLAILLLTAAAVSMARYDADQLQAFLGSDFMLTTCVVTHVTTIGLLAWFAATAPTPASRRSHAKAIATSCAQFALNLYLVLVVGRAEVQDAA